MSSILPIWLETLYTLVIYGLMLLLAAGAGRKLLRLLNLDGLAFMENILFALPLGFGIISYGVLVLGLTGVLRPWAIVLWLCVLALFVRRELVELYKLGGMRVEKLFKKGSSKFNEERIAYSQFDAIVPRAIGLLLLSIVFLMLVRALGPPIDYDGLMYHLQAPRIFLDQGRLSLLPDLWQANGPMAVEMLFAIGLAFSRDAFAQLIHVSCAVLLVTGVFILGRRYLGKMGGWVAAALFAGVPVLPLWAASAQVDVAWALFEFLALFAFILWVQTGGQKWLVLAGTLTGFGLGTKYLAISGGLVLGFCIFAFSFKWGFRSILKNCLLYGSISLLVGSPWYLKNLFLASNPVYPLFWGGPGWDSERLRLLMTYLRGFGTGHAPLDYLLLPLNLYSRHARFGILMGIEIPGFLYPLALLYPFFRRRVINKQASREAPAHWDCSSSPIRYIDWIAVFAALRFVLWAFGSQQTRFLLPVFPALSIITAWVLLWIGVRLNAIRGFRRLGDVFTAGLAASMLVITLLIAIFFFGRSGSLSVLLGSESRSSFLNRNVSDYRAMSFINDRLPENANVFMMWDGQSYYCNHRCLPDAEQGQWTRLVSAEGSVDRVSARLRLIGATHLLFSSDAYLVLQKDRQGAQQKAMDFFQNEFLPACGREIYGDEWVRLYELTC